ncbi:MAG: hypothetical protein JWR15_2812 [Prosthecobacter sp.]|nr:hypothetical protein [Prosthecobacter sp.]
MKPAVLIFLALALNAAAFDIKVVEKDHVDVSNGGKVVARLMMANDLSTPAKHHDTYKPYLHVFDASGATGLTMPSQERTIPSRC